MGRRGREQRGPQGGGPLTQTRERGPQGVQVAGGELGQGRIELRGLQRGLGGAGRVLHDREPARGARQGEVGSRAAGGGHAAQRRGQPRGPLALEPPRDPADLPGAGVGLEGLGSGRVQTEFARQHPQAVGGVGGRDGQHRHGLVIERPAHQAARQQQLRLQLGGRAGLGGAGGVQGVAQARNHRGVVQGRHQAVQGRTGAVQGIQGGDRVLAAALGGGVEALGQGAVGPQVLCSRAAAQQRQGQEGRSRGGPRKTDGTVSVHALSP
ncbi:hypothetical protein [Deinococcus gobiensis]|uniref:hypothetical protein n=1 Tax=Deinococcus gobiensis TaxID=502394 RepID=UPI001D056305|nr:hypothetical protein [Deinococcus gobiensis]